MRHGATRYVIIFVVPLELEKNDRARSTLPTSLLTVLARSAPSALSAAPRAIPRELACVKRGPQCGTAGTFLPAIRRRSS